LESSSKAEEGFGHINLAYEEDEVLETTAADSRDGASLKKLSDPDAINNENEHFPPLTRKTSFLYQENDNTSDMHHNCDDITFEDTNDNSDGIASEDTNDSPSASCKRSESNASIHNEFTSPREEDYDNDDDEDDVSHSSTPSISETNTQQKQHVSNQVSVEPNEPKQDNDKDEERLSINNSSPSFSSYGTTAKDSILSPDKLCGESQYSIPANKDNVTSEDQRASDLINGSLPVGFEIGNMKIRSASFYSMKQDNSEDTVKSSGSILQVPSLHGKFKTRHASFYDTIHEDTEYKQNINSNVMSRRTHHRMASENYRNPILYNRKTSVVSYNYNPDERRNNSFYRDRGRRTTATSEKSVFSNNSRRSSNASIALERQYQQERATFTQLCLVNFSFMIGYIPITVYLMWTSNITSDSRNRYIDYWFGVVAYLCLRFSECMNPVIYNFSSGNIRDATKVFLRKLFKRRPLDRTGSN